MTSRLHKSAVERGTRSRNPAPTGANNAGLEARRTALEILLQVEHKNGYADVLLGRGLAKIAAADRGLITRIVLGVLAWRARLDFEIAQISSRPLGEIAPAVLEILRIGLFQVRNLSRIPAHAAVNTAVSLAREKEGTGAAGFVNAVMRSALRHAPSLPNRREDEAGYLAVAWSHPRWMVEKFIEWLGWARAETLMAANNDAADTAIRLNLRKGAPGELLARIQADGMKLSRGGYFAETVVLEGAPNFESQSWRDGLFHVQGEASQLIARMLAPEPGSTVIDCAAAPGGKTTHLAELIGTGRVIAIDRNFARLKGARGLARRLGHRNISFVCADLERWTPLRADAEFVLLDAPCTGIGTLRAHPELRWRLRAGDFARMASIQRRMLEVSAPMVKPGGVLVYSVCSFAPEEGSLMIADFLGDHREFALEPPASATRELAGLIGDGTLRTSPDIGGLDGFFAARIRRRI